MTVPAVPAGESVHLALRSSAGVYVTDVLYADGTGTVPAAWRASTGTERFTLAGMDSQWFRAKAGVALPASGAPGTLWILASNGREDGVCGEVSLEHRDRPASRVSQPLSGGWHWYALPLPASDAPPGVFEWYDLEVSPPWDPGLKSFPDDLGVRIHAVVVRP